MRVTQNFCFPDRPIKHGEILEFYKRGLLKKGGLIMKRKAEGYDPH